MAELTFKIEHLSRIETTGKNKVATVRVIIYNNGSICDIKHVKIDYKFPNMLTDMLSMGYLPVKE
jgi:ribosomal protein S9